MKFNIDELLAEQENKRCIKCMAVVLCSLLQIPAERHEIAIAMGYAGNTNNQEAVRHWIAQQVGSSALEVDYLWLKDELKKHIQRCLDRIWQLDS